MLMMLLIVPLSFDHILLCQKIPCRGSAFVFSSLTRCTLLALLALLESKTYYVLRFKTSGGKNMISLNMFVPTLTLSLLARYVAALFFNA